MARASIIAILGLGVIAIAALWLTGIGPLLLGRWSFIQWAEDDRGTYFRVKVDVDYKGEPEPFDIVVGCNVRRIRYKDGSGTYEAGLIPTVYGRRMSDGQALVVRPPDACNGQTTANGKVPPNFIPLMIVYDDADRLDFGVAYLSDAAYASPLSNLTFHEASIETATRGEFDDFREKGPPNLVTPNSYFSIQHESVVEKMGYEKIWPAFGMVCHAYRRFRLPDEVRARIGDYWPDDRPNFWVPPTVDGLQAIRSLFSKPRIVQRDIGGPALDYVNGFSGAGYYFPDNRGVGTAEGGGMLGTRIGERPIASSFYPLTSDLSADRWPEPDLWSDHAEAIDQLVLTQVQLGPTHKGFGYCYNLIDLVPRPDFLNIIRSTQAISKVLTETIAGGPESYQLSAGVPVFYERDEYFFVLMTFSVDSTRGGV